MNQFLRITVFQIIVIFMISPMANADTISSYVDAQKRSVDSCAGNENCCFFQAYCTYKMYDFIGKKLESGHLKREYESNVIDNILYYFEFFREYYQQKKFTSCSRDIQLAFYRFYNDVLDITDISQISTVSTNVFDELERSVLNNIAPHYDVQLQSIECVNL